MNKDTTKLVAYAGMVVVGVGIVAVGAVRSHIIYKADIKRIHTERDLDLEAIRLAGDHMTQNLSDPNYMSGLSVTKLMKDFDEALAFEKIAIREK